MLPLAERLTSTEAAAFDRLAAAPATLLHGDLRLDNLFFPANAGAPPLVAVEAVQTERLAAELAAQGLELAAAA